MPESSDFQVTGYTGGPSYTSIDGGASFLATNPGDDIGFPTFVTPGAAPVVLLRAGSLLPLAGATGLAFWRRRAT